MKLPFFMAVMLLCYSVCTAQDKAGSTVPDSLLNGSPLTSLTSNNLDQLTSRYERLNHALQQHSLKLLQRLQRREATLYQQTAAKDSAAAARLFSEQAGKYQSHTKVIGTKASDSTLHQLTAYVPGLDMLYDFLTHDHLPQTQAFQFRVGYAL